jgi:hypothetical protein
MAVLILFYSVTCSCCVYYKNYVSILVLKRSIKDNRNSESRQSFFGHWHVVFSKKTVTRSFACIIAKDLERKEHGQQFKIEKISLM